MPKEFTRKFWLNIVLLSIGMGLLGFFVGFFKHSYLEVFSEKISVTLITTAFISLLWLLHEHMENAEKHRRSEVVPYKSVKNKFPKFITRSDDNHAIDICGISLLTPLKCFSRDEENYFSLLKAGQKINLRLLFCDPKSDYLNKRAQIEFKEASQKTVDDCHKKYVSEAWLSIYYVCKVYNKYKSHSNGINQLTIKMIENYALPITHFITDNIAITGYYSLSRGEKSVRVITYKGSAEYDTAKKEFDYLFQLPGIELVGGADISRLDFGKFEDLWERQNAGQQANKKLVQDIRNLLKEIQKLK